MQYSIPLPADMDAARIRERVAQRRALFDDHAGLVHKSFIYSAKDHLYAPFYLWRDLEAAKRFLLDDLFKGVVEAFSRHRVRSWIVLEALHGAYTAPGFARREVDAIDPAEALDRFAAREREAQAALAAHGDLCLHVLALDADRWEVMRYSLWATKKAAPKCASDCVQEYSVLHVSAPAL